VTEIVGCEIDRLRDIADQISAGTHLIVQNISNRACSLRGDFAHCLLGSCADFLGRLFRHL
jgi:hypothetical protein